MKADDKFNDGNENIVFANKCCVSWYSDKSVKDSVVGTIGIFSG